MSSAFITTCAALLGLFVLSACSETPRCVEEAGEVVLFCNDRKSPACDGPPESIYDVTSGGLLPRASQTGDGNGSCPAGTAGTSCRPSPDCTQVGNSPSCPSSAPICVFGTDVVFTAAE